MRSRGAGIAIVMLAALCAEPVQAGLEHHPSRIVVWFHPGVVALPPGKAAAGIEAAFFQSSEALRVLNAVGATEIEMLTPTATEENLELNDATGSTRQLDRSQLDLYTVTLADTGVSRALAALRADALDVREAAPDWVRRAQLVPNDPLFSKQWWLRNTGQYNGVIGADLHATAAWDRTTGLAPVDVVVIDTGVDASHAELAGRVIDGPNYIGDGPPDDDDALVSHGTSVAGIIAARGNNGTGVAGVDWNARIVRIKVLDANGEGYASDIDAAVDWARVNGYRIVNLSLGGEGALESEMIVFKNAYLAGMAVFAAMGNFNCACTDYPAGYSPFTIAVGAMMHTGVRWNDHDIQVPGFSPPGGIYLGSNTGPHIRFVAPGGRFIETTRSVATGAYWALEPGAGFYGFGGTSAATPAGAGVSALVQSLRPLLTGEDLAQLLVLTADDKFPAGFDEATGYGSINVDQAVALVTGQNQIEQASITSVSDISQQSGFSRTIIAWPGIPSGTYPAIRHTIRGTANFNQPFIATPSVWPRQASSYGASSENPVMYPSWSPRVRVFSAGLDEVTMEAYVYDLRSVRTGGHVAWWPTTPSGVRFAFTAVGPVSVTGVHDAASDTKSC